ncbi:MAG TPA: NAD(P)-dependent oxidoreductase [Gammaproteobacteria bacterium]
MVSDTIFPSTRREKSMKIGFIGLGRMGQAITGRIVGGEHDLVVYNRTRSKADELAGRGAKVAASVAEAAAGRDVVFTMLTDDKALREVVSAGLLEALPKGSIHVPMGTHSVTCLAELERVHTEAGRVLVAAPVLGRPDAAAAGQLGIVAAGPAEAIDKLAPVFALFGRRVFNAGTNPAGAAAVKLANNMVLGCAIAAMGEGFSLIRKYGVDPTTFFDVMTDGLFAAPAYKVYGNIIAKQLYDQAGFTTTLGLKDANLALAAALAANVPLPSLNVYRDRLLGAMAHGEADKDWSVIARDQARASGIE